jgi:hypothetical protein
LADINSQIKKLKSSVNEFDEGTLDTIDELNKQKIET